MSVDKLVDSTQLDSDLTSVANAIRSKTGGSVSLTFPAEFVSAINGITTGGNLETGSQTITATESSQSIQMLPSTGYDGFDEVDITVNAIPSNYVGSGVTQRTSSDLSASGATVTAPAGYYASSASTAVASGTEGTPLASKGAVNSHAIAVTPSVTNTAGYISGGTKTGTAVTVSASELVSGTYSVTGSGTADVTNYASISVPSGSATTPATTVTANPSISVNGSGLITATVSTTQSVTPTVSAGYVSSGTAGNITVSGSNTSQLPSATLSASLSSTSSTNSITLTPNANINTAGYAGLQSVSGTSRTITAADLVSGSQTVTVNDTYDVTNLASLVVNVSGGGASMTSVSIYNNTWNVLAYTDQTMTAHVLTSGSQDLADELMPAGSLIVRIRIGMEQPAPFVPEFINCTKVYDKDFGIKVGEVEIYSVNAT